MKYEFKTEPMDHQKEALRTLIRGKGGGLLMDPGTGKTKPTLDYLAMRTLKYGTQIALIAAPLSALDTWVDEAEKHIPDTVKWEAHVLDSGTILEKAAWVKNYAPAFQGLHLIILNHDVMKYKHKVPGTKTVTVQDRMIAAIQTLSPDVCVVDESHRLKTHTSNTSRSFAKLAKTIPVRIILTGTVAPKNPLDIYGQWQFLNPDRFNKRWSDFRVTYGVLGGWMGKEIIGFRNLDKMNQLIAQDAFVAKKEDCLDLPPVTDVILRVELSDKEKHAYREMGRDLLVSIGNITSISPTALVKILRLRQITGGVLGGKNDDDSSFTHVIGDSKLRVCIDKVRELVSAGEKVVIFAHFRKDVERITDACIDKLVLPVYRVDGSTPNAVRRYNRAHFASEAGPSVFVAQMRTMSLAVNELVVANHAIYYSYSERRDDYDQSRDRLNRKGQTKPVTFWHLVVPRSIDEKILRTHQDKGRLEDLITRDVFTLGE